MTKKLLSAFLSSLDHLSVTGTGDPLIEELIFDSRDAGPGRLFFALSGTHTDGHNYLPGVISAGTPAVVINRDLDFYDPKVVYIRVNDPRLAMSGCADAFYDHPSKKLKVIGVTGTDGKSTTVSFIHQLLEAKGKRTGFFSTVQWKVGDKVLDNSFRQSTPEAPQIQGVLAQMVENGLEYAVVESTSHGLSPRTNRLGHVAYDTAVFTNVTLEHLEFHGTVDVYRQDKARLFSALDRSGKNGFGVVNGDDPWKDIFLNATHRPCFTYSTRSSDADLYVTDVKENGSVIDFNLNQGGKSAKAQLLIPGLFNLENVMAALLAVAPHLGCEALDLAPLVKELKAVKGRMTPIREGQDFQVLVDYAHTPGAFEKLLPSVKAITPGRLIVVFGSGGERDQEKRPIQGALADQWAQIIILTDEDPRLEDSGSIIQGITSGIKNKKLGETLFQVTPRQNAVKLAINMAKKDDTVLLLGKGHEQCIIGPEGKVPYDEESTARGFLKALMEDSI